MDGETDDVTWKERGCIRLSQLPNNQSGADGFRPHNDGMSASLVTPVGQ